MTSVSGWDLRPLDSIVSDSRTGREHAAHPVVSRQVDRDDFQGLRTKRKTTVWPEARETQILASRATYPTPPAGPSVKAWVLSEQDRGQIFAPQSRWTATDPIHLTTYPDGSYGVPKDPNRPVFQSVGAPIATTVDWAAAAPWLAILGGIGLLAGLLVGASQKSG